MAVVGVRKFALEPVKQVKIEVGLKPGWEEEEQRLKEEAAAAVEEDEDMDASDEEKEEEEEEKDEAKSGLRSLGDSYLLLQSLRQSRYILLTAFFLKFSSKSKAKNAPEIAQPPHTLDYLGKCDMELGPHTFTGTKFYQVNYTSEQPTYQQWSQAPKGWAGAYGFQYQQPTAAQGALPPDSPGHGLTLTPELVAQVEAAAAADPELAHIRYLAAQNQASTEQLHKLGTLIQEINAKNAGKATSPVAAPQHGVSALPPTAQVVPTAAPVSIPAYQPNSYYVPGRRPDLIFEFRENPTERWLLPCDNSLVERRNVDGVAEAVLSTFLHAVDPAATAAKEREEAEARKREERRKKKEEKKEKDKAAEKEKAVEEGKEDDVQGKEKKGKEKETKRQRSEVEKDKEIEASEKDKEKKIKEEKTPAPLPKLLPATVHFIDVPEMLWHALVYCSNHVDPALFAHRTTVFEEMLLSTAPRSFPRYRLPNGPLPEDLEDAIADKFAARPFNPKDRSAFAAGSPTSARINAVGRPLGPDGLPLPDKPKERKLVSNTWKDGSPRWCQNCGTRDTIAWRRGPGGPGTLCQACGSRYKSRPEQLQLPEESWNAEKVMEKEVADKAAKAAAEVEAARIAAELAANPPPAPPPVESKPKMKKSNPKGELEPWSAYSHRDLSVQPLPSPSGARAESPRSAKLPPGQVEDATQITPRYRYATVWQDESGTSRYSESQTPVSTTAPTTKKPKKGNPRVSTNTTGYTTPTQGYHYDSRYGWYDYARGQWLQPHQYAQMNSQEPGQSVTPPAASSHAPPYYNDPYYQAYYRNYTQQYGQPYTDPRWANSYGSTAPYADSSKTGEQSAARGYAYNDPYPPGGPVQPYQPYYSDQHGPGASAGNDQAAKGKQAEGSSGADGEKATEKPTTTVAEPQEAAEKAAAAPPPQVDDPMDGDVETAGPEASADEPMVPAEAEVAY